MLRAAGRRLFRLAENNGNPCLTQNGELWFLRQILTDYAARKLARPFVAFDAGANAGDYTRLVLQAARTVGCAVEVHAFEPSPRNLECLREAFAGEPAVHIVGAALAAHPGEACLYDGKSGSSLASLVPRDVHASGSGEEVKVPLLSLADYVAAGKVAYIDLLKLDIEGSELAALRGLGDKLRPEFVDVIQFEYGGATLDAGATLKELHQLLTERNYVFAKLFPRAVELRQYAGWMEHYSYANFVALSPQWVSPRAGAAPVE
jgi:FkbM family methyltransferase